MNEDQALERMEGIVARADWLEWGDLFDMREELAAALADTRKLRQRMTELAIERLDSVMIAYHDGARDMQDKCVQAVERCHDAGMAGTIRSIPLPERNFTLL